MHPTASARAREVMQLRWLQPLGLSREECDLIKRWVFEYAPAASLPLPLLPQRYVVYGHSDDDYRKRALEFGRLSLSSYVIVVRYFRLQELFRREREIVLRPAEEAAAVAQVRRPFSFLAGTSCLLWS